MLVDYWRFVRLNPRFIGFGFLFSFVSSAGQTYFIGVFGPQLQADFGLDSGSWGRLYMFGTLGSALVINWSGSLIDRVDLRLFTTVVLIGLASACLVMGSSTSPLALVFAIFMLRQFGQGLASHTGSTSMARYFANDRGKALARAAFGYSCGEALLPVAGLYLSQLWGWRQTFYLVALALVFSLPLALKLLKGHGERHAAFTAALEKRAGTAVTSSDYTRRQMLSEPRFYYMLPALVATPMIGTALFFFPAEIAQAKNWSSLWVTGNYWLYSLVSVATTIYSGILIDRFSARRVLPFFLMPLGLSLVVINVSDHDLLIWPFMLLQGITSGLYFTGLSSLWAELYGARHLGAIKSMTNAVMVFSSALGPALVGTLLEWRVSFTAITLLLAGFCLLATITLTHALRMPSR